MADITISLQPEVLTTVGPFPITSSFMATVLTTLLIFVFALVVRRKLSLVPGRAQTAFEMTLQFMMEKFEIALGTPERTRKFFPLVFTVFIFLFISNQFTLIPFIESIVTEEGVSFFRTPGTHFSLPISLGIFMVVFANVLAFAKAPLRHLGNFIKVKQFLKVRSLGDLAMALLDFMMGLLDIVGEFAKIISISARLFGNLFAGQAIIAVIVGLSAYTQFFVPIPPMALGVLSSLVQAFVFAILSAMYLGMSLGGVDPEPTT